MSGRAQERRDRAAAERLGRWAEWRCVWWLRLGGYRILARRYRTPVGEIDIIARRGALVIFVEVKARRDIDSALFSVGERQMLRLSRASEMFLARYPRLAQEPRRFDVMAVSGRLWPTHVRDAWRPPAE